MKPLQIKFSIRLLARTVVMRALMFVSIGTTSGASTQLSFGLDLIRALTLLWPIIAPLTGQAR